MKDSEKLTNLMFGMSKGQKLTVVTKEQLFRRTGLNRKEICEILLADEESGVTSFNDAEIKTREYVQSGILPDKFIAAMNKIIAKYLGVDCE